MFFLLLFTNSVLADKKQQSCFILSLKSTFHKESEVDKFLNAHPGVDKYLLTRKIHEDVYNYCIENISDEEIGQVNFLSVKEMEKFEHLVPINFRKYSKIQKFSINEEYSEFKKKMFREIGDEVNQKKSFNPEKFFMQVMFEDIQFEGGFDKKKDL